ncbi:hypothetical protein ACFWN2_12915 [Lentzea sp. NPDC058436]|uniref:terpene synthase family protein n=1 Tax=Lentzea sp. NPDC058436 TaxID=3346499 RepID=UPI00365459AB
MSITLMVEQGLAETYARFPSRTHPRMASVESELRTWFAESEWAEWAGAAGSVARHRLGELAARAYPDAADPLPFAKLLAWMTVVDDVVESPAADHGQAVRTLPESLVADLPRTSWCGGAPVAVLADLWPDVVGDMAPSWQRRLRAHVADCFRVEERWREGRRTNTPPALDAYVAGRREDGVFVVGLDLVERELGAAVPPAIFRSDLLREFWAAAADVIVWTNDLLSADREIAADDSVNLVRVLEACGCSRATAVEQAMTMLEKRVREFFDLALQVQCAWPADEWAAERWVDGMKCTIRGLYEWSVTTTRYRCEGSEE